MNMSFNNDNKNIFTDKPIKNGNPLVVDINSFPILGTLKLEEETEEEKPVINFRTRPCRNVTNRSGICYRKKCSFAHSMEEWRIPECRYDYNCRYFHGQYNNFGNIIKGSVCRFKHSYENVDEWLNRTDQIKPNLPLYTVTTTNTLTTTNTVTTTVTKKPVYDKFVINDEEKNDDYEEDDEEKNDDDKEVENVMNDMIDMTFTPEYM